MGVGLRLTGYPTDETSFLSLLYTEGCNPVAAHRILKELREKGEKLTTVQASFNFERLGSDLERHCVRMEVIPPVETPNNGLVDAAALQVCVGVKPSLDSLTPQEVEEALHRAAETGPLDPTDLGPYSWVVRQG